MPIDESKLVTLGSLKEAISRTKAEYLAAIAASGHAKFQKVAAVPEASAAEENVLYLVKNQSTGKFDIYALIDGAMEPPGRYHGRPGRVRH